jgi:hypothetical protein
MDDQRLARVGVHQILLRFIDQMIHDPFNLALRSEG